MDVLTKSGEKLFNILLNYWSYELSSFELNMIKNKSILTLYISKSNLSDYYKSILILICEIEFNKYNPVFNNFSIIPSLFNSKIPIYFGSCHIWSYLFMKYYS